MLHWSLTEPPFRIDDTVPPQVRIAWLNNHAIFAARSTQIRQLALLLKRQSREQQRPLLEVVLAWVQRLPYFDDRGYSERFQGALWTMSKGGDCEDLATLFVAIALALGFRARVVWMEQPGQMYNHYSAVVNIDGKDTWAETTLPGAQLGEHPYAARDRLRNSRSHLGPVLFRPGSGPGDQPSGTTEWMDPVLQQTRPVNFTRAQQLIDELIDETSSDRVRSLDSRGYDMQRNAVVSAWNKLAAVYNAANFNPQFDRIIRFFILNSYVGIKRNPVEIGEQTRSRIVTDDQGRQTVILESPPDDPNTCNWFTLNTGLFPSECGTSAPNVQSALFAERIEQAIKAFSGRPSAPDEFERDFQGDTIVVRANIGATPIFVENKQEKGLSTFGPVRGIFNCEGNPYLETAPQPCTPYRRYSYGATFGIDNLATSIQPWNSGQEYNWNTLVFSDTRTGYHTALPPLRWSFEMLARIVRAIKSRGIAEWVSDGSSTLVLWNMSKAREYNLLVGDDFAGMRAKIDEYIENLPPEPDPEAEAAAYRQEAERQKNIATAGVSAAGAIITAAAASTGVGAVVGAVAAAITGIVVALIRLFGGGDPPARTYKFNRLPDGRIIFYKSLPPAEDDFGFSFSPNAWLRVDGTVPPSQQATPQPEASEDDGLHERMLADTLSPAPKSTATTTVSPVAAVAATAGVGALLWGLLRVLAK